MIDGEHGKKKNAPALKGIRFTFSWSGWSSKRRFRQISSVQRPRWAIAVTWLQGVSRNLHQELWWSTLLPGAVPDQGTIAWTYYNISQFHDRPNTFKVAHGIFRTAADAENNLFGRSRVFEILGRSLDGEWCFQKKVMTLEYRYGKQFQTL